MSKLLYEEFQLPANSTFHMVGVCAPPQKVIAESIAPGDVTSYSSDRNVNSGTVFHNRRGFAEAEEDLHARLQEARRANHQEENENEVGSFDDRLTSYYQ